MDVTRQTVQLGDYEGRVASPALFKRGCQCRPVGVPLAALDLPELGEQGSGADEPGYGLALRFKAQAADALTVGRDAVVGDKGGHMGYCNLLKRTFQ